MQWFKSGQKFTIARCESKSDVLEQNLMVICIKDIRSKSPLFLQMSSSVLQMSSYLLQKLFSSICHRFCRSS